MPRALIGNAAKAKDQSGPVCSRPNCSSKIYSSMVSENGSCKKGESLRPSTQSSLSGKEAAGRSSRTFPGTSNTRKTRKEPRQTPSSLNGQETKSIGPVTRSGTSRSNLGIIEINDAGSTAYYSSGSNGRKEKKRNFGSGSSSTAKGKKLSGSSLEGGTTISERRRSRNVHPQRDNTASVGTGMSTSDNGRERPPRCGNGQPTSPGGSDIVRPLTNQIRQCENSIAEVSVLLERLEQNEELTDEEIRLLEENSFPTGLNSYDRHRDMRMDIDNMSYEELLALGEWMGTVSTALTEEALLECLKRSIYQSSPSDDDESGNICNNEDIKCSICQDEYVVGDEMGSLKCGHRYHLVCIQQWLRLKNWCPICKSSAASSCSSVASNKGLTSELG